MYPSRSTKMVQNIYIISASLHMQIKPNSQVLLTHALYCCKVLLYPIFWYIFIFFFSSLVPLSNQVTPYFGPLSLFQMSRALEFPLSCSTLCYLYLHMIVIVICDFTSDHFLTRLLLPKFNERNRKCNSYCPIESRPIISTNYHILLSCIEYGGIFFA